MDTVGYIKADVRIVVFHSCTLRVFLRVIIVVINGARYVCPKILVEIRKEWKLADRWRSNPKANGWWLGPLASRPSSPSYTIMLHARIHDRVTRMIFSDFIQIPQYEHLLY